MIVLRRLSVPLATRVPGSRTCSLHLLEFAGQWPSSEKRQFESDMQVIKNFVTEEEEQVLMREIEPHISRLPYESSHWDDVGIVEWYGLWAHFMSSSQAIHGYREMERRNWSSENQAVLDRVSRDAFGGRVMPFVHILDLAELGVIKPHVDSTRVSCWAANGAPSYNAYFPFHSTVLWPHHRGHQPAQRLRYASEAGNQRS